MDEKLAELRHGQEESHFVLNLIKNTQSIYLGDHQVLTRLFTGQKVYVDSRDISVAPALMMDGHWEPETTKVFTSLLRPGDTFIDVGANMGYFGIVAGTVINGAAGGSIHMIEANPKLVPLVFKSINVTGLLGTASVANFAVSDQPGEVDLHIVKDLWGSSSLENLDEQFRLLAASSSTVTFEVEETVTVPAITLDAYAEQESLGKVDLVKIDIEGHEERAYQGMARIIDENRDNMRLLIEYSRGQYQDPIGFLDQIKNDFKFVYAIEHGNGQLTEVAGFDEVVELAGNSWIMLVASNSEITVDG